MITAVKKGYVKGGESVSDTKVSLEALVNMLVIDAYEVRYFATFDVPWYYLLT